MKIILVYIFSFLIVFLGGCVHKVHSDPAILSAINGGYPTAEFQACGSLWHGVGICVVEEGTSLEDIHFAIQGYYEGSVRIDSGNCAINTTISYKDSSLITDILKGTAARSCVLTFTVSPVYPGQRDTEVVTSGFRGHLRLKVVPPGQYTKTATFRIPQTFNQTWTFGVGEPGPVDVYFEGCGVSYSKQFTPGESHKVTVPLKELFSGQPRVCVLEGLVRSQVYTDLHLTAVVAVFYDTFNVLPLPVTEYKDGKLKINGDPAVSVLSVGGSYTIGNEGDFKVSQKSVVRMLTTKGRSNVGVFDPKTGDIKWILR